MRRILLGMSACFCFGFGFGLCAVLYADEAFNEKLNATLQKTEKSIKLLRQQIVESQSAPFLPDLYVQLAELYSEKSNTFYYVQKENLKDLDASTPQEQLFAPVIEAQQEAIKIYQLVLKDFPAYEKKRQALFRLAVAHKSIDDTVGFAKTAGALFKEFGGSEEASSVRLILGQQLLDQKEFSRAREVLAPVVDRPFTYERNVARYRLGLVAIAEGKFPLALGLFEAVIRDPQLKSQQNPYEVGLKTRTQGQTDLKREALIDSVRAYTQVHEKDPDPVGYYSKLAPSEPMFREVIEKLAQRYIDLKKYQVALTLLRTIGENTVDPQKVLKIYRQVLITVPPERRTEFPPSEMRFLLEKYVLWSTDFQIAPKVKKEAAEFFEKQLRDLATSLHEHAKAKSGTTQKQDLARAREFYELYLGYFRSNAHTTEMAADLADVYYTEGNYLKSGEYYLRLFEGEFGLAKNRKALIENAILCLQKKGKYTFYETLRMRGLLIASIERYQASDRKKAQDPALGFLLMKSRYEQGFFPQSIDQLYEFVKTFRKAPQAVDASELILDHFNTKSDFTGLKQWSERLIAAKIPNASFNAKLARIRTQANSKEIHEKIRSLAGYSDFEQGKSYLQLAMNSNDAEVKSLVIKEALAKSQREGDIQTFLNAAGLLAEKETDPEKKLEILLSLAQENVKVSQYYKALGYYRQIYTSDVFKEPQKVAAFEPSIRLGLAVRDWGMLQAMAASPLFSKMSDALRKQFNDQLVDHFDSPTPVTPTMTSMMMKNATSDEGLLTLFKAQGKLVPQARSVVFSTAQRRCSPPKPGALCAWLAIPALDGRKKTFVDSLARAPATVESIQAVAQSFATIEGEYRNFQGSSDPVLESLLSLRSYELYTALARFLKASGSKNADLRQVLDQKTAETVTSAKQSLDRCRQINEKTSQVSRIAADCQSAKSPTLSELFAADDIQVARPVQTDPNSPKLSALKRAAFSSKENNEQTTIALARAYLDEQQYSHAAAASYFGLGQFKDAAREFRTILGCSVLSLGYYSEANYHLSESDSMGGLREKCLAQIDVYKYRGSKKDKS